MYLVDTNVWLERLLDQARSAEVGQFLDTIPSDELIITDFALHSIGVILDKLGQIDTLRQFIDDLFVNGNVILVSLSPSAIKYLSAQIEQLNLDFDDGYQYKAAEQSKAIIVSFDRDFDHTERGRQSPAEVAAAYQSV